MADLGEQIRARLAGWAPEPFTFSFPEDWTEKQRDKFRAELEDLRINGIPEAPRRPPRTFDYPCGCPAEIQAATEPASAEEIEHWQQMRDKLIAEGATFHPLRVLPPGPLAYPGFEQMRGAILAALDLHADDGVGFCRECSDEFPAPRPCPTLRAIAEKLGIEIE
jgi:hypothetical protein